MLGKRIIVTGICGAGKSTMAIKLGEILNIPVTHIDKLFWLEGWVMRDKYEFLNLVLLESEKDSWIIDGNSNSTMEIRLKKADTVIWLKFNRFLALYRVFKRVFNSYGTTRDDMKEGCLEKIDFEFIWYILWTYPRNSIPVMQEMQKKYSNLNWVVLKSAKEVAYFMNILGKN